MSAGASDFQGVIGLPRTCRLHADRWDRDLAVIITSVWIRPAQVAERGCHLLFRRDVLRSTTVKAASPR